MQHPELRNMSTRNTTVPSVKHVTRGYYDALDALCSTLLVDPDFRLVLHGFGFDDVGMPVTYQPANESENPEGGTHSEVDVKVLRCYGTQAYHVYRHIVVVQAADQSDASNRLPVYSHLSGEYAGCVRLSVSSKSYSELMKQTKCCFPMQEGVRVSKDGDGTPRFQLASDVIKLLLENHAGNLALMHPDVLCSVKTQHNSSLQVDTGYTRNPGKLMQGIENIIAFETAEWPSCAGGFKHRKRNGKWPPRTLVEHVMAKGIYVIPYSSKTLVDRKIAVEDRKQQDSTGTEIQPCFEWTYSFVEVEKALIQTLQEWHIELFHYMMLLNSVVAQICGPQYTKDLADLFKTALFWCLEQGTVSAEKRPRDGVEEHYSDVTEGVRSLLQYLGGCFEARHMSHYFIDNCNLLEDLDEGFLSRLSSVVTELLSDSDQLESLLQSKDVAFYLNRTSVDLDEARKQRFHRQLVQKTADCVEGIFTDMYKLAYMTLYATLHRQPSIDRCMEFHESVQRALSSRIRDHSSPHPYPKLIEWCSLLVSNSLANLYLVKALTTPASKKKSIFSPKHSPCTEKMYYHHKAEELLLMSNNIDLMTGRVRLANFYLVTNRLQEALDLLRDIISLTANENDGFGSRTNQMGEITSGSCSEGTDVTDSTPADVLSCETVRDHLLQVILERNCILDLLFSEHEKPIVPPVIKTNLSLTKSMLMGLQPVSIYVFDTELFMRFLHVLTLINLAVSDKRGKGSESKLSDNRDMGSGTNESQGEKGGIADDIRGSFRSQAVEELEKLEQLCNKEQRDMNEKRNVAYYNTVAKCYLLLGMKDKAIPALQESIQISPNPVRNPARFMLYSLQNDVKGMMIKGGIGVAVGIGIAATLIGLVRCRFS